MSVKPPCPDPMQNHLPSRPLRCKPWISTGAGLRSGHLPRVGYAGPRCVAWWVSDWLRAGPSTLAGSTLRLRSGQATRAAPGAWKFFTTEGAENNAADTERHSHESAQRTQNRKTRWPGPGREPLEAQETTESLRAESFQKGVSATRGGDQAATCSGFSGQRRVSQNHVYRIMRKHSDGSMILSP